jgi:hypothetical protein
MLLNPKSFYYKSYVLSIDAFFLFEVILAFCKYRCAFSQKARVCVLCFGAGCRSFVFLVVELFLVVSFCVPVLDDQKYESCCYYSMF